MFVPRFSMLFLRFFMLFFDVFFLLGGLVKK